MIFFYFFLVKLICWLRRGDFWHRGIRSLGVLLKKALVMVKGPPLEGGEAQKLVHFLHKVAHRSSGFFLEVVEGGGVDHACARKGSMSPRRRLMFEPWSRNSGATPRWTRK